MDTNEEYLMLCLKNKLYTNLIKYLTERKEPYLSIHQILDLLKETYMNDNDLYLLEKLQNNIITSDTPDFSDCNIEDILYNLQNMSIIKDLLCFVNIDQYEFEKKIKNLQYQIQHIKQDFQKQLNEIKRELINMTYLST